MAGYVMSYTLITIPDYEDARMKYSFTRKTLQYICGEQYDRNLFFESDELLPISCSEAYNRCVARIKKAIELREKVVIYGDYDVDGICSTTILHGLLTTLGLAPGYYIPNRIVDGYGLQAQKVEQFHEKGYQLIVCVDNGVVAHEALSKAAQHGMEVVIIDHHEMDEKTSGYPYVLHPELMETPFHHLCGAGLAFEFSRAFGIWDSFLALAALGTIADMMLLAGENRRIVRQGLKQLNQAGYLPLQKFAKDGIIDEFTLGMQIAPKLNTLGRLPDLANTNQIVKYFALNDETMMDQVVKQVETLNERRKEMSKAMVELAKQMVNQEDAFFVLVSESFHEGLVGIAANQLLSQYHKPVMVCQLRDGICKGSIRSKDGLDLVAMMRSCPHVIKFGGHQKAGGITFAYEHLQAIHQYIQEYMKQAVYEKQEKTALQLDLEEFSLEAVKELQSLRPLLSLQSEPLYLISGKHLGQPTMLSGGLHWKWQVKDRVSMLYFSARQEYLNQIANLQFLVRVSINEFKGKQSLSMQVQDVFQVEAITV